jgi:PAS domain S-box-containing protein
MDGTLVDVNPAYAEIVGRSIDEIKQLTYWDITPEKYADQEKTQLHLLKTTGKYGPYEKEYIHADGHLVPVKLQGLIYERSGENFIWSSVEDITEYKIAEKQREQSDLQLQLSEKRYKALFEHSPDGILIADTESYYLDANTAMCSMLGYSREEIIGFHAADIVVPEEVKYVDPALADITSGKDYSREWLFRRKDGSTFSAEVTVTTLPDGNLLAVVRDITERKEAERELLASEFRHRSLFEHMMEGMAYHKVYFDGDKAVDYEYLQVNEAFGIHTGLKNVIGKKVSDLVPGIKKSNPELLKRFGRVARTGKPERYETYVEAQDQWYFTALYSLEKDIVVSVFDNITIKKVADKKIKESEKKYRELFNRMSQGVTYQDSEGTIIDANPAALKILGLSLEQIKGKSSVEESWRAIKVDGSEFPADQFPAVLAKESGERIEDVIMGVFNSKLNEHRWLKIDAIPQPNQNNKPPFDVVATFEDITEIIVADKKLAQANDQLRELFANLDKLREEERKTIARELHDELGQVITSIRMSLNLLLNNIINGKFEREHLITEIEEMQSIIDVSKDNIKRLIRFLRPVFLDSLGLIAALEHIISQMNKSSELTIEFKYNTEELSLKSYIENIVFRATQECLTNILKHSKADFAWIDLNYTPDQLKVSIKDNGVGIDETDLEKKESFGILGIKERLKTLGSDLHIRSIKGEGTTISFSIPLN